jgi:predicted aspartyl protease
MTTAMLACVAAGSVAASGAVIPSVEATPFERGEQGGVIVPVMLNGQGPFRFLLDTGSTHTTLSERVADKLGAPPIAQAPVGSAAGWSMQLVVRLDTLRLGPHRVSGLLPSVLPLDAIDPTGTIDGVIGQDVLASLHYTIDYRRRQLFWPLALEGKVRPATALTLESREGRFLVDLPQRDSVLRLVPDSGAATLLLFEGDGTLPDMTLTPATVQLRTTSAQRTVRLAKVRELVVGQTTLRDIPAVLVAHRGTDGQAGDGLLPLHLFERVTFDGPRGLLIIED